AGALLFVFITPSFYGCHAARRPGINVHEPAFRKLVSPLIPAGMPALSSLVRDASTASFRLAMMVGAVLLIVGAIVNAVGIRDPGRAPAREGAPGRTQPAK